MHEWSFESTNNCRMARMNAKLCKLYRIRYSIKYWKRRQRIFHCCNRPYNDLFGCSFRHLRIRILTTNRPSFIVFVQVGYIFKGRTKMGIFDMYGEKRKGSRIEQWMYSFFFEPYTLHKHNKPLLSFFYHPPNFASFLCMISSSANISIHL